MQFERSIQVLGSFSFVATIPCGFMILENNATNLKITEISILKSVNLNLQTKCLGIKNPGPLMIGDRANKLAYKIKKRPRLYLTLR